MHDFERLLTAIGKYEGKRLVDLPVPGPSDPVNGEHLALINSSWRTPIYDAQYPGHEMYRFDVILAGNPIVLARVEKVVYMLPAEWPFFLPG
jgi:hypothetical protein